MRAKKKFGRLNEVDDISPIVGGALAARRNGQWQIPPEDDPTMVFSNEFPALGESSRRAIDRIDRFMDAVSRA